MCLEYQIDIRSEEIVRCLAQLGNNKKHTIFLFILPNCSRRLEAMIPKISSCSLIVLFMAALSPSKISLMLHIFHNMSKNSLFGSLFSETDQDGALTLLTNVKPGIKLRVAEKVKEVTASRSLDVEYMSTGDDAPSMSNRLMVPISQERRSLSLNDAPMVAAANQRQNPQADNASHPLDLSSANVDNSMWNGAVHSNRNLTRTKFHFKQRSLETSKWALAAGGSNGAKQLVSSHKKAQRQYAVDNGSDDDEEAASSVQQK